MSVSVSRAWAHTRVSAPSRHLVLLGAAALIGVLQLWLTVGWYIVSPSDPIWHPPQGDTGQAVLGAEAFLRDPAWHFPLAVTHKLLSSGKPISIVYTDSAPWASILVKAAGLGVSDVSVVGLVAVLSILLLPVALALLFMASGLRRAESVLTGAVLGSMLPAWYLRMVWHVALSSHWVIVLALAMAAVAVRKGVSRSVIAGLAALGALSIGIHAYLFFMVAAVAVGALLADVARVGRRALPRAAVGILAFLACSAVSSWVLGYSDTGGGGGYGCFSMNVLSPFVPQRSGLRAALTGDAGPIINAYCGEYEGFNYLGAGIGLVIAAAALVAARHRAPRRGTWRAVLPLGATLLALTALALTNKVYIGDWRVLDFGLPLWLDRWLGQVRSSGRMFWPVAYAALAWSLLVLDRSASRARSGAVLAAALLLQFADTSVVRRTLAEEYVPRPKPAMTDDAAWSGPLAGQDVRFLPSDVCVVGATSKDYEFIRQTALAAERSGSVVEGAPVARYNSGICVRERIETASLGGKEGRLDIALRSGLSPATLALAMGSGRCAALGENLACGAAAQVAIKEGRLPRATAPALAPLVPGQPAEVARMGAGTMLLGPGWRSPEAFGAWTEAERAFLVLPLPTAWTGDATFALDAIAYGASPFRLQEVTILAGGHAIAQWLVPFDKAGRFTVRVPASALADGSVLLELVVPHPLMLNKAGRVKHPAHGFGLQSVTLLSPQG